MSFFKKIFNLGCKAKLNISDSAKHPTDITSHQTLLEQYCGVALEKQLDFYEIIGDQNWNADMDKGEISFGDDRVYPLQFIGSLSHSSQTWLWAWANKQADYSPLLLQQATELRQYGKTRHIDLFTKDKFDAQSNDLHFLGTIASGMFDTSAYYIADYGQGAMLVTLKSETLDNLRSNSHTRIVSIIPQMTTLFEINHKNAIKHYLTAKGYEMSQDANKISATRNNNLLLAEFDDLNRLVNFTGEIKPQ